MKLKPPEIRRILLGEKYYFHSGIPPVFSSKIFAEKSDNFPKLWQRKLPPPTMSEQYKYAQHGGRRRDIRIPNPVNQFYVAHVIAKNWRTIERRLKKSRISKSNCDISHEHGVYLTPHRELVAERLMEISSHSHILKTDISNFFPSFYTHSVPWAIHGKPKAKKNPNDLTLWGNALDKALSRCNDRQTSGIPIGPATSLIVSEIIMAKIDSQVQKALKEKSIGGYRHVDDYFLCLDSEKDAEAALAAIEKAAAEYELNINAKKTQIIKSAEFVENAWPRKLKAMSAYRKGARDSNWLTQFASEAFSLAKQHPQDYVMKYALLILGGLPLSKWDALREENWKLYESILIRIMTTFPYTTDIVADIFWKCRKKYPLNNEKLSGAVSTLIAQHAPLEHHSEVAWALWLAKVAGLDIKPEAARKLPKVNSGICALLALDNMQRGIIRKKGINLSPWRAHLSSEGLKGKCWLLAYEAPRKGWLGDMEHITDDKCFSALHKRGISFYNEDNDDDGFDDSSYP